MTLPRPIVVGALAVVLVAAPISTLELSRAYAAASAVRPGLWKSEGSIHIAGSADTSWVSRLFEPSITKTECIVASRAASGPLGVMYNDEPGCRLSHVVANGAHFSATRVCQQKSGSISSYDISGTYSTTAIKYVVLSHAGGSNVRTAATVSWIGKCQ